MKSMAYDSGYSLTWKGRSQEKQGVNEPLNQRMNLPVGLHDSQGWYPGAAPLWLEPDWAVSSEVEHVVDIDGVTGSIPVPPTIDPHPDPCFICNGDRVPIAEGDPGDVCHECVNCGAQTWESGLFAVGEPRATLPPLARWWLDTIDLAWAAWFNVAFGGALA